ncbi:MAG: alpha-glucosidase [Fibrobacter sp.]|nr:alpha-glucosidase [Fibrobacter sp.]
MSEKNEISKVSGQNVGDWWKKTVVYEIYPSSFQDSDGDGIGDLTGIRQRLDYLESLGVGAIWLTPVYASPMVDNGYDVSDFCSINPMFGTMEDMERLIAEAKEHGIRIVMDLVMNHTSDQCPWFLESRTSRNNPRSDWYIWRDGKTIQDETTGKIRRVPPNNWRGIFGGSVWQWCEERDQYYMHTFATAQPDLNWECEEVRQALYRIANFWIEKGVGGFRIDAIPYIKKPTNFGDGTPDASDGMASVHTMTVNTEGILDLLQEFKANVTEGRDIFTVAEANGVGPQELKHWVGENGAFDMLFEFSHIHDVELWCKPGPFGIKDLKNALIESQKATARNGWYPIFFENHDKPRCINNFFSPTADPNLAAKAMATLTLTLRGTPFIYQGQELGMTNVKWDSIDAYNEVNSKAQYRFALQEGFSPKEALGFVHRFSRDNARTPMQWTTGVNAGFTRGLPWLPVNENFTRVNAESEAQCSSSVLRWYKCLIALRQQERALREGSFEPLLSDHPQVFAYRRFLEKSPASETPKAWSVVVNLSETDAFFDEKILRGFAVHLCNYRNDSSQETQVLQGILRPLEAVILRSV